FFFFQAEDGLRDFHVTGVQTCALPIWRRSPTPSSPPPRSPPSTPPDSTTSRSSSSPVRPAHRNWWRAGRRDAACSTATARPRPRSEERRVGKDSTPSLLRYLSQNIE